MPAVPVGGHRGHRPRPEQLERVAAYRIVLATFWLLRLLPDIPGHARNPAGSLEAQATHLLHLLADPAAG